MLTERRTRVHGVEHGRRRRRRAIAAACAACLTAGGVVSEERMARADNTGFTPYALVGVTYDDNLFRLSDDTDTVTALGSDQRDDIYRVAEVGADLDARWSRQHFNLHGDVNQTRFSRYTDLNNEGGSARARWDWVVTSVWQGQLGYDYRRQLADLDAQNTERNLRADQRGYLKADFRPGTKWRARVGAEQRDVGYSLESQNKLDVRATTGELGLHYLSVPAGGSDDAEPNYIGPRARVTRGDHPNPELVGAVAVDNSYDEGEAGLVTDWRYADLSRLQAFLGYTERRYDELSSRDFAGATGRMIYGWQMGAKTVLNLTAWRELTIADDQSAGYVLTQGAHLGPDWSMTRKITWKARIGQERRDYRGDAAQALAPTEERVDRLRYLRLALEYAPVTAVQLALAWRISNRESNIDFEDYDDQTIAATLRAHF